MEQVNHLNQTAPYHFHYYLVHNSGTKGIVVIERIGTNVVSVVKNLPPPSFNSKAGIQVKRIVEEVILDLQKRAKITA